MHSVASRQLRDIVESGEWSQVKLAREFDVSRQAVKQWIDGDAKPNLERIHRMETLLGIPTLAWTQKRATPKRTGTDG